MQVIAQQRDDALFVRLELFALGVMRRIHRGVLADLEFGTGKLEQIANLVIGVGMLGGAAWIVVKALAIVIGERTVGAPFGLALAAITAGNAPARPASPQPFAPRTLVVAGTGWNAWVNSGASSALGNA